MSRMLDPRPDGRPAAAQLVSGLSAKHFCDNCCQQHQKGASRSGRQAEPLTSMSRLSIQANPGVVAGPSMSRLSIQANPGVVPGPSMSRLNIQPSPGIVAGPSAPLGRRGSAPAVSMSQGPTRTYAPRGKTQVVEEDDSDEDEDGDDSDDTE